MSERKRERVEVHGREERLPAYLEKGEKCEKYKKSPGEKVSSL